MTRLNDLTRKRRRGVFGILAALPFSVMGNPADPAVSAETAHRAVTPLSCIGTDPCLMVVTFNQKYDIVWVALNSRP
jgi:hypothetical protein